MQDPAQAMRFHVDTRHGTVIAPPTKSGICKTKRAETMTEKCPVIICSAFCISFCHVQSRGDTRHTKCSNINCILLCSYVAAVWTKSLNNMEFLIQLHKFWQILSVQSKLTDKLFLTLSGDNAANCAGTFADLRNILTNQGLRIQ